VPSRLIGSTASPSWASWRPVADRLGQRWPGAAGFGETLQDMLPASLIRKSERDATVEIDPLELNVRGVALRPPGVCQVLLRCVRDSAGPEEGERARPDDRFQRAVSLTVN
jgi:hypothetical protein